MGQPVKFGETEVELRLRDRIAEHLPALERRLKATGETIAKMGAGLAAGSAAGMATFTAAAKSVGDAGMELSNLSARTGVAVGTLSELEYAATRVGASMSDVETIVTAISEGRELELWGSKSAGVLRLLNSDMAALRSEAKRLGATMNDADASAAVEMAASLKTSAYVVSSLWREVGSAVAPAVKEAADGMRELLGPAINLIRNNREVVRVLFVVLAVAAKVGAGMVAMAAVISSVATVFGFLSGAFLPLLAGVGILTVVGVAAYQFRDKVAAALGSVAHYFAPLINGAKQMYSVFAEAFGGVVAALGSGQFEAAANIAWLGFVAAAWTGIDLFTQAVDVGLDYLQSWIPAISSVTEWFKDEFGGLFNAILAGRWDLAGQIMMTKLQLVWQEGLDFLLDAWDMCLAGMKSLFPGVVKFISDMWHGAIDGIAQSIMWVMEKLGMAEKGSMDMLAKMQEAEAKERDKQSKRDPYQIASERIREREQGRQQLRDRVTQLDKQADLAHSQASAPTVTDRAKDARADLAAAIAKAKQEMQERGDAAPGQRLNDNPQMKEVKTRTEGSFTAAAAVVLGGGNGVNERIEQNTRMMSKHLANINDNTKRKGATK